MLEPVVCVVQDADGKSDTHPERSLSGSHATANANVTAFLKNPEHVTLLINLLEKDDVTLRHHIIRFITVLLGSKKGTVFNMERCVS